MSSQIANFYQDKSVFITGGTGFLGKVLIEKLLRSCPEVKHIYVLIRCKRGQDVRSRLRVILEKKIFENYGTESLAKVVAIEGDLTVPGLGICDEDMRTLERDVSLVFHSAATVKFDEPLKTAVNYNLLGTQRVADLCRKLPSLLAFIYVSTVYSNCNRIEIDETIYPPPVPPHRIIDLCESMNDKMLNTITHQLLDGFPNTYTFTKNLSETLLAEEYLDLPVAILRPSIIGAAWSEPIPGWVDSPNSITGFMVVIGKGILRHALINNLQVCPDIIPVDTVINSMIAIGWRTAIQRPTGVKVYNCVSGSQNIITWKEVCIKLNVPYSIKYPTKQLFRYPSFRATSSKFFYKFLITVSHLLPAYVFDTCMYLQGRKSNMVKVYKRIHLTWSSLEFVFTKNFQLVNNNLATLFQELNDTDKLLFNMDIRDLNWIYYWNAYWKGVRLYTLGESRESLREARRNLRKVHYRDVIIKIIFYLLIYSIILIIIY